jgi:hypothetical protein
MNRQLEFVSKFGFRDFISTGKRQEQCWKLRSLIQTQKFNLLSISRKLISLEFWLVIRLRENISK